MNPAIKWKDCNKQISKETLVKIDKNVTTKVFNKNENTEICNKRA